MSPTDQRLSLGKRVELGCVLLDEARPGWENEINLHRLAMDSTDRDILGQLYGNFVDGFRAAIRHRPASVKYTAATHGFTLYNDEQDIYHDPIGTQARFNELTELWRKFIEIKRNIA